MSRSSTIIEERVPARTLYKDGSGPTSNNTCGHKPSYSFCEFKWKRWVVTYKCAIVAADPRVRLSTTHSLPLSWDAVARVHDQRVHSRRLEIWWSGAVWRERERATAILDTGSRYLSAPTHVGETSWNPACAAAQQQTQNPLASEHQVCPLKRHPKRL